MLDEQMPYVGEGTVLEGRAVHCLVEKSPHRAGFNLHGVFYYIERNERSVTGWMLCAWTVVTAPVRNVKDRYVCRRTFINWNKP